MKIPKLVVIVWLFLIVSLAVQNISQIKFSRAGLEREKVWEKLVEDCKKADEQNQRTIEAYRELFIKCREHGQVERRKEL